jgi:hydroxymethylpyrimidine/phosphomethylpyrimidine kinase
MKKVLTIAGSDSGGGAGIQADLKTFSARGVFGMSVITALTAQNTVEVQGILNIEPEFVGKQIDSVMTDIGADAWKTGMLSNTRIIEVVANRAKKYNVNLLVVDPVMVAKSGDFLLQEEAKKSLIANLIPLSYIITPNIHETKALTGLKLESYDDVKRAAIKIYEMGTKNVLIKGGHMGFINDAVDILYDGNNFTEFRAQRIKTKNTHGTGCTYASAIASELAKDNDLITSVHKAKAYLTVAIIKSDELHVGKGHGPVDHFQGCSVDVDLSIINVKEGI